VDPLNRPEEQLHRAVVQLLGIYEARGLLSYCHVPNGERRDPVTGARLKAMGVRAGVPDLLLWSYGSHFQIELKAGQRRPSAAQDLWRGMMATHDCDVHVCRSIDEVEAALRAEGVPAVGKIDGKAPESAADAFLGAEGTRGRVGGISSHSAVKKSEPA
jgi:hypothetical protein